MENKSDEEKIESIDDIKKAREEIKKAKEVLRQHKKRTKPSINPYKLVLIILLSITFLFGIFVVFGNKYKVPYTDYETYYETEPYTDWEEYTDYELRTVTKRDYDCYFGILCDKYYQESEYVPVEKARTVTRYRDIAKQRPVTRYHSLFAAWNFPAWIRWDI